MIRVRQPLDEHPFELLFGLLAILAGAALSAGVIAPTSINASLPELVVRAWGGTQLLAGMLMVSGIVLPYIRPPLLLLGLRLERGGLWPLSGAAAVYGLVALAFAGGRAAYTAGVLVAVMVACVSRARAVARLERTIIKHSRGRAVPRQEGHIVSDDGD